MIQKRYDLTYPQKNIWLVDMVNKNTDICIISGVLKIKNCVYNKETYTKVMNELVRENEGLRIRILLEGNEPKQYVSDYKEFEVESIDLSEKTKSEIGKYLNYEMSKPIDIFGDRLYEFKSIKYSENEGAIMYKLHHIIGDAWSMIELASKFASHFENNNIENREQVEVPSYVEYINTEEEYTKSEKYLKDKEFWDDYLKDISNPVSLKTVSKKITNNSKRYIVKLEKELNDIINTYCKENRVSPYVLFLTALSTYIYRIKENNDFIIGTPVLNRSNFKEKQMIGMFVSTIPMRFKIEENIKFIELAKKISSDTMSIFRHQKYPYSKILEDVHNTTDVKTNLYNIVLSYQNARANYPDKKKYSAIWAAPNHIQDDLDIHIVDINNEGKLEIYYDYLVDLFDKIEIEYLHTRLVAIIEDAIKNDEKTVEDIRIMSLEEENKILYEFNDTDRDYPKDKTVIDLFEEQVEKAPDNIALVFEDKQMTYRELNEKANNLACYLIDNYYDVKIISLIQKRGFNLLISILAILKSGKTYVPIDPNFPVDRINYMIENSESGLIIKSKNVQYKNEKIEEIIIDNYNFNTQYDLNKLDINIDKNNTVYIIYTSGTTGLPKGVMIDHKNIVNLIYSVFEYQKLEKYNVFSCFSTYSFDIFILETFIPLSNGKTIIMSNEQEQLLPDKASKLLIDYKVEVLYMTPTRMKLLIDYDNQGNSFKNLKTIMLGGEIFPENYYKKIRNFTNADIYDGYGPTEITVWCTAKKIMSEKNINIGKALPNMKTMLLDNKNRLLPILCVGELCIGGKGVGKGYYNNVEYTNKKFVYKNGEIVYKTGDCCYYNFEGDLNYLYRNDSQIKLHGLRIEIDEIENVIKQFELIEQVCVIVKDDKLLVYYISASEINEEELKNFLRKKLPRYMLPNMYMRLKQFDINIVGKIDKKNLPDISLGKDSIVEPTNDIENIICDEIKRLTEINNIGVENDIFEYGMDSISVIKLVTNLKEKNINIKYNDVFDYPTIRLLSSRVAKEQDEPKCKCLKKNVENLTPAQKSIFMQYMLDTESTLYNIPFEITFSKEKVKIEKLLTAINKTVLNHPILFSHFTIQSGDISQVISDKIKYNIKANKTSDKEYESIKMNFVKSFDLLRGPLFEIAVYETSTKINILFNFHHIIFDGTSMLIFIRDMINYYNEKSVECEKQLFLDYVKNRRINLKDIEYFKKIFEEEININNMPYDRHRTKNIDYNGNKIYAKIDTKISNQIKIFIVNNKLTLNSFMQSVFSLILAKYMYNEDITYGIANSSRNNRETENMIGMFVKNMPYRTKIDWTKSIIDYIKNTQKNVADILSHDSVAYEDILKEINYTRSGDRNPLMDIMFVCQNINDNNLNIENEKIIINEIKRLNSKFDITFEVIPYEEDIDIAVEYKTALFDESTILGFINNYINIIKFILENNNSLLSDINMISEEEKNVIINKFNDTKTSYPNIMSIHQVFEKNVNIYHEKTAVVFEKEKMTYEELNKKANRLARLLIQKGLNKGDVVAVLIDKSSEYMIALLGILKAGGAYMPISEDMPEERIKYVINDSSSKFIITTMKFDRKDIDMDKIYINISDEYSDYKDIKDDTNLDLNIVSCDKAYVMYTSGTTGVPKGITIIHRGITRLLLNTNLVNYVSDDIMLVSGSVTFDTSGFEIWGAMFYGMSLHFMQKKNILNPKYYEKYILTKGITTTLIPTPIFNQLTEYNATMFRKLRTLYVGGDVLLNKYSNEIIDKCPNTKLINIYGPTENTVISSAEYVDYKTKYDIFIGKPISNSTCYVVDKCEKLCPIKVPGELYTGGDGLALGYINKHEVTNAKFVEYKSLNEKVYKTGDLVSYNEQGKIKFFGRIDTQIKLRGQRIEILEIQNKILEIWQIKECVVVLKEQENNKFLVAYYTAKSEVSEKEIFNYLNKFLPNYMIPYKFIKLDKMPLNQNSKIDRKKLPDVQFKKGEIKKPENVFQDKILSIYKDILNNDEIGMDDNFFDIGGDSLSAMKLVGIMEENDIHINYADIFQYPTPIELYNKINDINSKKINNFGINIEEYDYKEINNIIKQNIKANEVYKENLGNVLLTGATGFLGAHILDELLKLNSKSIIYCLVRGKNGETPKERLYKTIEYYFGNKYKKLYNKKIIAVDGDITTSKIIYDDNAEKIIEKVKIVINSSAHVKHFGDEKIFDEINIKGTNNISNFCINNNKKLIHISTLSISGNLLEGGQINQNHINKNTIYDESSLYISQKLDNIYALSKFIAERNILENVKDGKLNATIIRVGNLTGRYLDGKIQINSNENAFLNRIRTFKEIKFVPENILDLDVEFSPVDLTAKAICTIAELKCNNIIYHVYNPNHIKLRDIVNILNKIGFCIKIISKEKMTEFIKEYMKDNISNSLISGIIQDLNSSKELEYQSNIKISCKNTVKILSSNNFVWPIIDSDYIIKFLKASEIIKEDGGDL